VLRVEAVRFTSAPVAHVRGTQLWAAFGTLVGIAPQAFVALSIVLTLMFGARPGYALATKVVDALTVRAATRDVAGIAPVRVRGALVGEPPHIAAAIISALPAATATAVLELYPPDEREAIVRRLARAASPLVPDAEELVRVRG
jgi:flagellar motor switch protein FliG